MKMGKQRKIEGFMPKLMHEKNKWKNYNELIGNKSDDINVL